MRQALLFGLLVLTCIYLLGGYIHQLHMVRPKASVSPADYVEPSDTEAWHKWDEAQDDEEVHYSGGLPWVTEMEQAEAPLAQEDGVRERLWCDEVHSLAADPEVGRDGALLATSDMPPVCPNDLFFKGASDAKEVRSTPSLLPGPASTVRTPRHLPTGPFLRGQKLRAGGKQWDPTAVRLRQRHRRTPCGLPLQPCPGGTMPIVPLGGRARGVTAAMLTTSACLSIGWQRRAIRWH
eukprot:scaffold2552_cov380-Prasinococcus_capsulatus_cf.AAC.4